MSRPFIRTSRILPKFEHRAPELALLKESRVKILGAAAIALCSALVVAPAVAQPDTA